MILSTLKCIVGFRCVVVFSSKPLKRWSHFAQGRYPKSVLTPIRSHIAVLGQKKAPRDRKFCSCFFCRSFWYPLLTQNHVIVFSMTSCQGSEKCQEDWAAVQKSAAENHHTDEEENKEDKEDKEDRDGFL